MDKTPGLRDMERKLVGNFMITTEKAKVDGQNRYKNQLNNFF